ncbi:MopE-related protein [Geojedonia litorea]|uniref:MopE-related protein n=1 Tax=Geojedonia litorea TaxID=1268269 RepID=A0ABV9N2Y4_9FLAO
MRKCILSIFLVFLSHYSLSQCINGTENSIVISSNDGFLQELSNNVETSEYVTVNSLVIGHNYQFTSTRTGNTDYITVTNTSNTVISHGVSPLTINNIQFNTIRIHVKVNSGCDADAFFHEVNLLDLTVEPTTCQKPESNSLGISFKSDTRIDLHWNTPVLGSPPSGYDWEIVPDGNAPGVGTVASGFVSAPTTSFSTGNVLSASTTYDIYLRSNCVSEGYGTGEYYLTSGGNIPGFTTNANPPPSNDLCTGAITLVEETSIPDAASATPTAGTLLGGAGTDADAELCGGSTGNARDDVWYKFVAQTSNVNITVEPNNSQDFVLTLYSGDCNSLSYLDCSDTNINSPAMEEISYSGLTIGNTYFTRVYYYGTNTPANPTFNIKIWTPGTATDADGDGYSNTVDCDDNNASIYPGATEIVGNGIDENCDGMYEWYQDNDGDGYGTTVVVQSTNSSPGSGESNNSLDCNDSDPSINPGATDVVANGVDEDCDGMFQWYQDNDGDGYGTTVVVQSTNSSPGAGESNNSLDCNDSDPSINPGATDVVANGVDENCDGMFQWYQDNDGDGYGTTVVVQSTNSSPGAGESNNSLDCNDSDPSINPGATDVVANGVDENCDGMFQWYQDNDGDGYGTTVVVQSTNSSPGAGESNNSLDCNDSDPSINPGATDVVANGVDENCDGMFQWYQDNDGDGYGTTVVVQSTNSSPGAGESSNLLDCNDSDPSINPGATDVVANGVDENCDGMFQWYQDNDGDGYGTTVVVQSTNSSPGAGESSNSLDCNDSDPSINPGMSEVPNNGIDDDCNPSTPDGTLGEEDLKLEKINVYPNPFNGKMTIHLPPKYENSDFEITLIDLNGRRILNHVSTSVNRRINIENLHNLELGTYFLRVKHIITGQTTVKQLLKY